MIKSKKIISCFLSFSDCAAILLLLSMSYFPLLYSDNDVLILCVTAVSMFIVLIPRVKDRDFGLNRFAHIPVPLILLSVYFALSAIGIVTLKFGGADMPAGRGYSWLVPYGGTLFVAVLLSLSRTHAWRLFFLKAIAVFGIIFASSTIIFWVCPQLYDAIFPSIQKLVSHSIEGRGYRAGLTTHYSTNATYIVLGFLACFSIAFTEKRGKKWSFLSAMCFFALILTSKRAHFLFGVLSAMVLILIYGARKGIRFLGKIAMGVVGIVALLLALSIANSDIGRLFSRLFEGLDGLLNGRGSFYALCISMWMSSPIVGCGWGSFNREYLQLDVGVRYLERGYTNINAHNIYLQTLAEQGILGLLPLILGIAMGIKLSILNTIESFKLDAEDEEKGVSRLRATLYGSLLVQLFVALYGLTGNPIYDSIIYIPWLLAIPLAQPLSELPASNLLKR